MSTMAAVLWVLLDALIRSTIACVRQARQRQS